MWNQNSKTASTGSSITPILKYFAFPPLIVFYSIDNDNLIESPFEIDEQNGEIKTIQDLDFETQNTWYLVIQARDKDALETATATVTVLGMLLFHYFDT